MEPNLSANGGSCPLAEKHLARCLDDNTIVFLSRVLGKWVDDSGRFHSGHALDERGVQA